MAAWLLKTEPSEYSYEQLEGDGRAVWDGVRNPLAMKHMRNARAGDEVFIYHTGRERAIVGIGRVETDAYPDPDADDESVVVFDVAPVRRLERPVTLDEIKSMHEFSDWELVRIPRLSVLPIPDEFRSRILDLAATRL